MENDAYLMTWFGGKLRMRQKDDGSDDDDMVARDFVSKITALYLHVLIKIWLIGYAMMFSMEQRRKSASGWRPCASNPIVLAVCENSHTVSKLLF